MEQILRDVLPNATGNLMQESSVIKTEMRPGTSILVADDSPLARSMIEKDLLSKARHLL